MYLTTVAILTILMVVFITFFPEVFLSISFLFKIDSWIHLYVLPIIPESLHPDTPLTYHYFYSFIVAIVAAIPICAVLQALSGVASLEKENEKKED